MPSFPDLQALLSEGGDHRLHFYVFDLLHLHGWDLRPCALIDRKRLLSSLADWRGLLCYSEPVAGSAGALYQRACATGGCGTPCIWAAQQRPWSGGRKRSGVKEAVAKITRLREPPVRRFHGQ